MKFRACFRNKDTKENFYRTFELDSLTDIVGMWGLAGKIACEMSNDRFPHPVALAAIEVLEEKPIVTTPPPNAHFCLYCDW